MWNNKIWFSSRALKICFSQKYTWLYFQSFSHTLLLAWRTRQVKKFLSNRNGFVNTPSLSTCHKTFLEAWAPCIGSLKFIGFTASIDLMTDMLINYSITYKENSDSWKSCINCKVINILPLLRQPPRTSRTSYKILIFQKNWVWDLDLVFLNLLSLRKLRKEEEVANQCWKINILHSKK